MSATLATPSVKPFGATYLATQSFVATELMSGQGVAIPRLAKKFPLSRIFASRFSSSFFG
jgi:hypothetical protein